jgi:hypothetical protein
MYNENAPLGTYDHRAFSCDVCKDVTPHYKEHNHDAFAIWQCIPCDKKKTYGEIEMNSWDIAPHTSSEEQPAKNQDLAAEFNGRMIAANAEIAELKAEIKKLIDLLAKNAHGAERAESAERRLAELTEAAREVADNGWMNARAVLRTVLDRQAREVGSICGRDLDCDLPDEHAGPHHGSDERAAEQATTPPTCACGTPNSLHDFACPMFDGINAHMIAREADAPSNGEDDRWTQRIKTLEDQLDAIQKIASGHYEFYLNKTGYNNGVPSKE